MAATPRTWYAGYEIDLSVCLIIQATIFMASLEGTSVLLAKLLLMPEICSCLSAL